MTTRSEDMRYILDQIQQISVNEGREFFMPDQREVYEELIDLLDVANENMLYNASDWLRNELNQMNISFKQ